MGREPDWPCSGRADLVRRVLSGSDSASPFSLRRENGQDAARRSATPTKAMLTTAVARAAGPDLLYPSLSRCHSRQVAMFTGID